MYLGRCKTGRIGKGSAGSLHISQGFANNLLGDTGAFATLGCYTGRFTHFSIAAATFIDGFTDLAIGHALAKTHVHMNYPLGLRCGRC